MKIETPSWMASPHLWTVLGTLAPPLNVFYASMVWMWSCLGRPALREEASRCLNVQLTYTLIFFVPILIACLISAFDQPDRYEVSVVLAKRLATGFPLGLISLSGIVLLAFFNVRSFAHHTFGEPRREIPRIKFVAEE